MSIIIGILDIQGSVKEHFAMLKKIGAKIKLVKLPRDLEKINGLIIPGGESTAISKLLKTTGLDEEIKKRASLDARFAVSAKPRYLVGTKVPALSIWGTCAGAILISSVTASKNGKVQTLGLMDIEIERNAYGSQMNSFESTIDIKGLGKRQFRAIFIRAPRVRHTGKKVDILAQQDSSPVMMQENNFLATTFHPELTADPFIHSYFIKLIQKYAAEKFKN